MREPIKQAMMTESRRRRRAMRVMMLLMPGTCAAVEDMRVEMDERTLRWSANSLRVA